MIHLTIKLGRMDPQLDVFLLEQFLNEIIKAPTRDQWKLRLFLSLGIMRRLKYPHIRMWRDKPEILKDISVKKSLERPQSTCPQTLMITHDFRELR